jgi:hypothetical protein
MTSNPSVTQLDRNQDYLRRTVVVRSTRVAHAMILPTGDPAVAASLTLEQDMRTTS